MKDRQVEHDEGKSRIPVVSSVLHCVSMTVLVFLRHGFGYVYLRPKSVFFAFSWAFVLFSIYAYVEPHVWQKFAWVCIYGLVAVLLYWVHFGVAFAQQVTGHAQHDHFSGNSNILRVARVFGVHPTRAAEMNTHLWVEPGIIIASSAVLRIGFGQAGLSRWLFLAGCCLLVKELLNYWSQLRQRKRLGDRFGDAGDISAPMPDSGAGDLKATRQPRKRRQPASIGGESEAERERKYAEMLRLMPPYSMKQAEANYRQLMREAKTQDDQARQRCLNEAMAFFRVRMI